MLIKSPQNGYPQNNLYPPHTQDKQKFSKRLIRFSNVSQKTMFTLLILFALLTALIVALSVGWVEINRNSFDPIWDGLKLVFNALKAAFGFGNMVCTVQNSDKKQL